MPRPLASTMCRRHGRRSWLDVAWLVVLLGLSSAAAGAERCRSHDGVFRHGDRESKSVALTFDACPTRNVPGFAADIVATLEREKVPATFFLSGRWAQAHPEAVARLAAVPYFEIAMHGHRHPRLLKAGAELVRAEIEDGRAALLKLDVTPQPLLRPPYGDVSPLLVDTAHRLGVEVVTWDVAPGDPVATLTSKELERFVLRTVRGGSIIVLHVNGRGVATPAALPEVIAALRARGFEFARVSDLVRTCEGVVPATKESSDDRPGR